VRRDELAHILRAAARIVGDGDILIIGSQAILATYDEDELPAEAWRSVEADVAFFDDPVNNKSDHVDGAIGEDSPFHSTHGIYGQGVSVSTAVLPAGWRERLVPFERGDDEPSRAKCLDAHDLVCAKLVAGREKDFAFASALIDADLVSCGLLLERARLLEAIPAIRGRVVAWIESASRRRDAHS